MALNALIINRNKDKTINTKVKQHDWGDTVN